MNVKYKYVHEDKDRHGNTRVYFKRPGGRKIRLRGAPGTREFQAEYDAAVHAIDADVPEEPKARPSILPVKGTLGWLCHSYMNSVEFRTQLGKSTQNVRRLIFEGALKEKIAPDAKEVFRDFPLNRLSRKAVKVLRDRKAETPEAANSRLKAFRRLFKWAIAEEIEGVSSNHAADVDKLGTSGDGWHTWTMEEVEQFQKRHSLGTKAHLALSLLLFTGARRSDVVTFGPHMIRDGWLHFTETKGRDKKSKKPLVKDRQIPVLPELQAVLDGTQIIGSRTFLVTSFGRQFTGNGFGNWFRDRCNEAELKHCSAHGLRKAGATIAAENGATGHQLMSIYGWENTKQADLYTKKANRRKLAGDAMHLVVPPKPDRT
jgi:integrase